MTDLDTLVIEPQPERPVQYFKPEDLERGRQMMPEQIVQFLDDFANMMATARRVDD
ncbi:MAG TPA: hypothetical protein VIN71_09655 [Pseudomonadales bacterium]